eukprot:COSAG04_NODE_640_length_11672_cov_32.635358_4_plen_77_part_00
MPPPPQHRQVPPRPQPPMVALAVYAGLAALVQVDRHAHAEPRATLRHPARERNQAKAFIKHALKQVKRFECWQAKC